MKLTQIICNSLMLTTLGTIASMASAAVCDTTPVIAMPTSTGSNSSPLVCSNMSGSVNGSRTSGGNRFVGARLISFPAGSGAKVTVFGFSAGGGQICTAFADEADRSETISCGASSYSGQAEI